MASEGIHALADALDVAGVQTVATRSAPAADALVDAQVDDRPVTLIVWVMAYCTGAGARELLATPRLPDFVPLVVAEKITADARELLSAGGWSWLDRRGRLHLRGPALRVDLDVASSGSVAAPSAAARPIAGRGGIAVAYWLCSHPGRTLSPTKDAPSLRLAPSTISAAATRLADAGLVDEERVGVLPELFWELAAVWRSERTWLASAPDPGRHRPADMEAPSWRRTGAATAVAYGAPVVSGPGGPIELYVTGPVELSIAVRRYGSAEPGAGAAVLAVPPTSAVNAHPHAPNVVDVGGWRSAPVLAVALDLAQDRARGREILDGWDHPEAVWREAREIVTVDARSAERGEDQWRMAGDASA